jgi:hypothetical protein
MAEDLFLTAVPGRICQGRVKELGLAQNPLPLGKVSRVNAESLERYSVLLRDQ